MKGYMDNKDNKDNRNNKDNKYAKMFYFMLALMMTKFPK